MNSIISTVFSKTVPGACIRLTAEHSSLSVLVRRKRLNDDRCRKQITWLKATVAGPFSATAEFRSLRAAPKKVSPNDCDGPVYSRLTAAFCRQDADYMARSCGRCLLRGSASTVRLNTQQEDDL